MAKSRRSVVMPAALVSASGNKPLVLKSEKTHVIHVEQVKYVMREGQASIHDLRVDLDNPRLYADKYASGKTEEAVCDAIWKESTTKKLAERLKIDGEVIEPIYVLPDGTVIEGNRRLVCCMNLVKQGIDLSHVPVRVIPQGMLQSHIDCMLMEWNKGKKRWNALAETYILYRAWDKEGTEEGMSIRELARRNNAASDQIKKRLRAFKMLQAFRSRNPETPFEQMYMLYLEVLTQTILRDRLDNEGDGFILRFDGWCLTKRLETSRHVRDLAKVLNDTDAREAWEEEGKSIAESLAMVSNVGVDPFESLVSQTYQALEKIPLDRINAFQASKTSQRKLDRLQKAIMTLRDMSGIHEQVLGKK